MGEYSKSAIIKFTRKAAGMTQEELGFGICEPFTISRYENGQLDPTDDKFARLMQKMGEKGDVYLFPIECEASEIEKPMEQIMSAIEQKNWELVEELQKEMKEKYKLPMKYVENIQYMKRIEIIMKYHKKEISGESAIKSTLEALRLTLSELEIKNFPEKRIIKEVEVLLVFNLATFYGECGDVDKALKIYSKLDKYFNRKDILNNYKPRYLIYLAYSNFLGRNGYYDKSIKICTKEIEWLLKNNQSNYLYNFYYNLGWNIRTKIEHGLEQKERIHEAKMYVWLAYKLCVAYPENKNNEKIILKFYSEMF